MIAISCKEIKKSYGIDVILKDITFNVNDGDKIGLIGANGAGKSTLFKILTKELDYDSGDIFIDKNKVTGYLSQHLSLQTTNTIIKEMDGVFQNLINMENKLKDLEEKLNEPYDIEKKEYHDKIINEYTSTSEIYSNSGGYTYRSEIYKVLNGLGFKDNEYDKEINILSGGEKTRIALCKLLLIKPDILLLDEPTNHLDLEAIQWLEEYLQNYKGTIFIISHDRYFLDTITTHTFELINGRVDCYNGSYSSFMVEKQKNREVQLKAYELQKSEIKRQEEIIERYRSFNREKSIRAAESREKMLNKIERIEAPDKESKAASIKFETAIKSGNDVLHCEELSKSYGEKKLFSNITFDIKREEKIALIGDNGIGKTTLFKIILGKVQSDIGTVVLGKNVFVGYYDQEQSNLNPQKNVIDEVWDDFPQMTTTEIRNALASFLFYGDDVFKKISDLSGGEKCKINLLKLMLSNSNLLLLDEPTNHLDIMSREALEEAILNYDGTIFVISHDRYFLNKVMNKIYELTFEGIVKYAGNYSYYIEKKKNPKRFMEEEEKSNKTKTQIQMEKKKVKEIKKQEKENIDKISNLEKNISDLEKKLEELQSQLCLPEVYSNPQKTIETTSLIKEIEKNIGIKYEEWGNII